MAELNWEQVLLKIKHALDHRQPFSLVRIGDGENVVMAQKSVWRIKTVLSTPWARRANNPVRTRRAKQGHREKGVTLPNLRLRDQMVRAVRKANIVGILPLSDSRKAMKRVGRPLTNKIFRFYRLKPRNTCGAFMNCSLANRQEFWEVLRGRRILLVTQHACKLKQVLQSDSYKMHIAETIGFSHYKQMSRTLKQIKAKKNKFDVALISCGVNSVVLAPEVARLTGKVAIDFGKGSKIVLMNKTNPVSMNHAKQNVAQMKDMTHVNKQGLVSIVITAHNGLKNTMKCIESVNLNTPEKFEYVLADYGSTDGTAEYFKKIQNATVILNKVTKGHAELYNQCLRAAKGEYIVLLSSNVVISKGWLSRMFRRLQKDPTIGIVGLQGSNFDLLNDVCIMFHRNLITQIGGFDQRFHSYYGGIHDFYLRTLISGKKLQAANGILIHRDKLTSSEMIEERKLYEKWKISKWENIVGVALREMPFNQKLHYVPLKRKD